MRYGCRVSAQPDRDYAGDEGSNTDGLCLQDQETDQPRDGTGDMKVEDAQEA